jgi:hypothetical protein
MDIELAQTAIRRCLNEAIARGATSIVSSKAKTGLLLYKI